MAFRDLVGGLLLPKMPRFKQSNSSVLNGATEKLAVIFRIPKSGTLDQFEFASPFPTLNAASRIRLSFQNVSAASGDPDGTQDEFVDMAIGDFTGGPWQKPATVMTDDGSAGGVKRVVTRGDLLAAVIEYDVFTAADTISIFGGFVNVPEVETVFPFYSYDSGAGYIKSNDQPRIGLVYSDGSYAELSPNIVPSSSTGGQVAMTTATSPDEAGAKFRLPFPVKVGAAWAHLTTFDSGANADLVLYDSDGTSVLGSASMDWDISAGTVGGRGIHFHHFNAEITLLADTFYRIAVKPTAGPSLTLMGHTMDSIAMLNTLDGGADFHKTSRTDAGGWTDDVVSRMDIGIYATAFDSGGAAVVGGSFSRGMVT